LFLLKLKPIVKRLSAILFSVLLVWAQLVPAQASADGAKPAVASCDKPCCHANCCMAGSSSNSQPAPAVPAQKTGAQNQISFLASAVVAWTLPENPANLISSTVASPLTATGVPLYERHCALLL
jgi:hypothetical protein